MTCTFNFIVLLTAASQAISNEMQVGHNNDLLQNLVDRLLNPRVQQPRTRLDDSICAKGSIQKPLAEVELHRAADVRMDAGACGELLYTAADMEAAIERMASDMAARHGNLKRPLVLISIMKGGCYPGMMLMRKLVARNIPTRVDFVWLASGRDGQDGDNSGGEMKCLGGPQSSLESETVVLIDDLVESGLTLARALEICRKQNPAKLEVAVVFEKKGAIRHREAADLQVDYVGLEVPNELVFGGLCMDYKENLRSHPDVYVMRRDLYYKSCFP